MPEARLANLRLAYDVHAGGPKAPVLMVMGFGLPGRVWRFVIPELTGERRVITFDNRGAGRSEAPPGGYRMAMMADDAVQLLDHLGLDKVHLVGVSMGGMICQELALAHRDRLWSLSLLATHPGGALNRLPRAAGAWHFLTASFARGSSQRLRHVARLLFPKPFREQVGDAWLMERLREDFADPPPRSSRRSQLAAVARHDTRARLPRLAGLPTLIVKPEADLLVRPHNSELLHELIPGSTIVRFADAGHGLIRQKGAELGVALRAHFAAAEG